MATMKMPTYAGGGGATEIPFTLAPSSGRCTFNSQNCYIYMDGSTPKMHLEFNATMAANVSANAAFISNMLPFKQSDISVKSVIPNNLYVLAANTGIFICSTSALSSGAVLNINTDITLEW